jgi:hypothetical protein
MEAVIYPGALIAGRRGSGDHRRSHRPRGCRSAEAGGRIVAELILGLIDADDDSYFNARRPWVPRDGSVPGQFFMHDLLRLADAL